MNSKLLRSILCAGCLAGAGLTTLAGPLNRADVPAEPAWVVHLDFDGLRSTVIGQVIQEQMNRPEVQDRLAAFQAVFSLDLRTQLHAATLYSCGTAPEDGVLLFYADFDANRLVTLARAAKDAQSTTYNNHAIYSWIDEKKPAKAGKKPRVYASIAGGRVVFGQRQDRVGQALDVLDRTAPSLVSSANFPLVGVAGDNSFVEAAARKMDLAGVAPNARVLRLSKSVLLQVTEAQQQFTAIFSLEANNPEVAGNINSIAQGLVALMKLQTDQPEALKLANAIAVAQNGTQITSTFSMPTPDLLQLIRAAQARKAAHPPSGL
jgi:hypothetical protein